MDPRTVQGHLSRLKKINYIFTWQTRRSLAFEITLKDDKYVAPTPAGHDNPVT